MRYESEILYDLMKRDGLLNPSQDNLPYESELKEKYVNEVEGAYPKLQDYRPEWLNYNKCEYIPADFPTESQTNQTSGVFENVVPYAYESAILKGSTKYSDIDTGEFLETFEEGRNLELVSVKMPVLTTIGKNLFDGELEKGNISSSNGLNTNSDSHMRSKNFINVEPNKVYAFSVNTSDAKGLRFYDNNKNFISSSVLSSSFTTPSNCKYVRFIVSTSNPDLEVQIEKNLTSTAYEPYKTNILTVKEDVVLRSLLNGVCDTLNVETGEYVQRIKQIVLDGSRDENWVKNESMSDDTYTVFHNIGYTDMKTETDSNVGNIICDKFKNNAEKGESITRYKNGKEIKLKISTSKLTTQDTNGLRQWVSQNPITLQYELATPIIKTVDLSCINENNVECDFIPIMGTMHYQTSSDTIPPLADLTVCVEATTQNLASFVHLEGVEENE